MLDRPVQQVWQLEMFPGGSRSGAFESFLQDLEQKVHDFEQQVSAASDGDIEEWAALLSLMQWIKAASMEAESFIACLEAQDLKDEYAKQLNGQLKQLSAAVEVSLNRMDSVLLAMDADRLAQLLQHDEVQQIAFALRERREIAAMKLPPELESIISKLSVDGYHAWGDHYQRAVARIQIEQSGDDGELLKLSAGQAANRLHHPDRQVRSELFTLWEQAWAGQADLCAAALNHLAGFRLSVYDQRDWTSVWKEPLLLNRMSEETLQAMWQVVEANKEPYVRYLRRKAELLGLERLSWTDVEAPLGSSVSKIDYSDAAEMIVGQFRTFSTDLSEFAQRVFNERWIEAEDRPDKRPGGFCTAFPLSQETRIFMTYSGTPSGVSTLAHELGHAYHQHVMNDMPMLAQDYAMNVAETASTFAELIIADAAVRGAADDSERIALLDEKLQSAVAFYMNIHARFLFETAFYEERRKGIVSAQRLNELMEQAQRKAYCDELEQLHPHFWASKLHFYLTDVPFYNFPYTFGYMFSAGIYAIAEQEGAAAFAPKYVALLRDTASMRVEELAAKHLGVDLTQRDFWQAAIDKTSEDVELFLRLTE